MKLSMSFFLLILFCLFAAFEACQVEFAFKSSYPNWKFSGLTFGKADSSCCIKFGSEKFCLNSGQITYKPFCGSPWFFKVETIKNKNITQALFDVYLRSELDSWYSCVSTAPVAPAKSKDTPVCNIKKSMMDVGSDTTIFITSSCYGSYHCTNGVTYVNGVFKDSTTFTLPNALSTLYHCEILTDTKQDVFWVSPGSSDICVYMGIKSLHGFLACNYPTLKYMWISFLIIMSIFLARLIFCVLVKVIFYIYVGMMILRGRRTWDTEVVTYKNQYSKTNAQPETKTKSIMLTSLLLSLFVNPANAGISLDSYKEVSLSSILSSSNITVCSDSICQSTLITSFYLKPEKGTCFIFDSAINADTMPIRTYACVTDFSYSYPLLEEYQTADPLYTNTFDGYCIGSPIVTCPPPAKFGFVKNFYFNSDINQGCWIWGQTDICVTTDILFGPRYHIYSLGQPVINLSFEVYQKIDGQINPVSEIGTVTTVGSFFDTKPFTLLSGEKIIKKPDGSLDVGFAPSKYAVEPFRWGSYQLSDNSDNFYFPSNPLSFSGCTGPNGGFKCTVTTPNYDYATVLAKPISVYNSLGMAILKGANLYFVPFQPSNVLFTVQTNFSISFSDDKPCPEIDSIKVINSVYGLGKSNPVLMKMFSTCESGPAYFTSLGCTVPPASSCFINGDFSECVVDVVLLSTKGSCTITAIGKTSVSATFEYDLVKETTLIPKNETSTVEGNAGSSGLQGFTYGLPNYLFWIILPIISVAILVAIGLAIWYLYKKPDQVSKFTKSSQKVKSKFS